MWVFLFFVGVLGLYSLVFNSHFGFKQPAKIIIGCLVLGFIFTGGYIIGVEIAFKNALLGKNPYKMEVKYIVKDSVYTPSDTIFVLIKD